jgi:hypothetical protein
VPRKQPTADLLDQQITAYARANRPLLELLQSLLPYQLEAVLSPHSHKAVLATRRAGKSHAACVALILAAHSRPGAVCWYLALTRASAKRIAWRTLKALCRERKIKAAFSESELTVTFKNDSTISLTGVNQENLLDNLRGTPIDLAVLDEAGSYRGGIVEELIEEVIEPAFADYDGKLMVIGTPTPQLSGFFYNATTGKMQEFERYRWDIRDNPHINKGDPRGWLERHRKKKGWSLDNPKFRREYCGEWVQSLDLQVYRFTREKNVGPLPDYALTQRILAVDLGFKDETAFVVLGYNPLKSGNVYVMYTKSESEMQLATIARTIQTLQETYGPHATVIDEGGLGKSIAEDWRTRLGIPCEAAKKTDKRGYIETLNSELHEGRLIVPSEHRKLIDELLNLTWDDDLRLEENPSLPNHLCDALLYGWRASFAYTHRPKAETPVQTAEEAVESFWDQEAERLHRKGTDEWWEQA